MESYFILQNELQVTAQHLKKNKRIRRKYFFPKQGPQNPKVIKEVSGNWLHKINRKFCTLKGANKVNAHTHTHNYQTFGMNIAA